MSDYPTNKLQDTAPTDWKSDCWPGILHLQFIKASILLRKNTANLDLTISFIHFLIFTHLDVVI